MCGRVVQASGPELLGLRIVSGFEGRERRGGNLPPRYNAAPSQELWVIDNTRKPASAPSTS
jgi:putative SOS response-associated peptidase YedK